MQREKLWIQGERVDGETVARVASPFDGAAVAQIDVAGRAQAERAAKGAADAVRLWRDFARHRRHAVLQATSEALAAHAGELATLMARESGKPIALARGEVARAATTFRLAAGEALRFSGETLPLDLEPRGEGRLCIAERVPRGAVLAIAPFNFPLNLVAHKLAPAFALAMPVVLKPPPQSPLTALRLAALLDDAGLPRPLLSVIHCAPEVAEEMARGPHFQVLSFTGSAAVGWHLKSVAGKKQVLLELGGNAPCIVDEGADVDAALKAIVPACFAHGGQVCIKVQRLYLHASLHDAMLEKLVAAAQALPCGDPLDERTVVGPLVEMRHVERVRAWIDEAVQLGARLHCGGQVDGMVMRPAVLTGVPSGARVHGEEVFGPVVVVERFVRFDDALARANRGRYGLQAGVFTPRLDRALEAHRELEFGGVIVNDAPSFRIDNFPYGGTKDSGFGREGVRYAMEEMTEWKVLVLRR